MLLPVSPLLSHSTYNKNNNSGSSIIIIIIIINFCMGYLQLYT